MSSQRYVVLWCTALHCTARVKHKGNDCADADVHHRPHAKLSRFTDYTFLQPKKKKRKAAPKELMEID